MHARVWQVRKPSWRVIPVGGAIFPVKGAGAAGIMGSRLCLVICSGSNSSSLTDSCLPEVRLTCHNSGKCRCSEVAVSTAARATMLFVTDF